MRSHLVRFVAVVGLLSGCDLSSVPTVTAPDRNGHSTSWFPITEASHHGPGVATCDDCHGAFDTFRKFDCVTCHAGNPTDAAALAATHAGEPGFPGVSVPDPDPAATSAQCYLCHADGTAIGVDHTTKFPIATGDAHFGVKCSECHVSPADRKVLGCAGCHPHEQPDMATAHAGVTGGAEGYEFTSAKCYRCHSDSQTKTVATHLPFGITSGDHSGARALCLKCHPGFLPEKPRAANFGLAACLPCHGDAHHRSETCYAAGCHPDGQKHGD